MYSSNLREVFMKFTAVYSKMLKTVKRLPNVLCNIDIVDLCLLPSFCIFFKRRLESVTKLFMFEVVLANFETSEPIDA